MTDNPYAPPGAQCVAQPRSEMFLELRSQSTWRLLGLGIITYGIYYAHYCARQSKVINRYAARNPIPQGLVLTTLILSYASVALFLGYLVVDEDHPVALASNLVDRLWMLVILVWGFYARNRANSIARFTREDPRWINGFWTFLFSPLHFNYKVNVVNQAPPAAHAVA